MLRDLRIQNFAIIEDLSLTFDNELNIITGDTGAGKSILVGALGLILGGRGSPEMIRTNAAQARITACFEFSEKADEAERIRDMGVEIINGELIIHRTLSRSGKNKVTLNGDPATVGLLSRIAENLVDIHGQHEHHSLMNREHHLELLDSFGKLENLLSRYSAAYVHLVRLKEDLHKMEKEGKERERRIDFLQYQIREIDEFDLRPSEEKELTEKLQVLRNAERILTLAQEAYAMLYESENSISDRIGQVMGRINDLASLDNRTQDLAEQGEELKYRIEDMSHTLRDYTSRIEPDPDRLASLEDRLEGLRSLKRKYGEGVDQILDYRSNADEELKRLMDHEANISRLNEEYEKTLAEAVKLAGEISRSRTKAARKMEKGLEKELGNLGMSGTRFIVQMEAHPNPSEEPIDEQGRALTPKGIDSVEFLVSPNPGEEPKPLIRIASGGELSRIMLAIKTVLADVDKVRISIFDEVDSGIGGGVAEILGRRLSFVAQKRQVICVTHLPQVASQGNTHHHIAKEVQKGRTRVSARQLYGEDRVREIARMLGGVEITKTTVQHAKEMIKLSG
jgi:DNA repair protein RecN (Recombination protein N)